MRNLLPSPLAVTDRRFVALRSMHANQLQADVSAWGCANLLDSNLMQVRLLC